MTKLPAEPQFRAAVEQSVVKRRTPCPACTWSST